MARNFYVLLVFLTGTRMQPSYTILSSSKDSVNYGGFDLPFMPSRTNSTYVGNLIIVLLFLKFLWSCSAVVETTELNRKTQDKANHKTTTIPCVGDPVLVTRSHYPFAQVIVRTKHLPKKEPCGFIKPF
jgi:hypothetical protein